MNGRMAKAVRRKARIMANKDAENMVSEFKALVNTKLNWVDRLTLSWRIMWKIF